MQDSTTRLNKYLANLGICSRRDVKHFLKLESVTVNGEQAKEPGIRINPYHDTIHINGKVIKPPQLVYYLLNKPKGVVSTTADEYGRKNVISYIKSKERIYPVGTLDKDTTGLIILTNDGELTNMLTHPKYHVNKVYRVLVKGRVNAAQLKALRNGVLLSDGITSPAEVKIVTEKPHESVLEITIHEGRNRQIRRMCETVSLQLLELQRIKFGPLVIGKLEPGQYRQLTRDEIQTLKALNKA